MVARRVAEEVGRMRRVDSGVVERRCGMRRRPIVPLAEVRRMDFGDMVEVCVFFFFGGVLLECWVGVLL